MLQSFFVIAFRNLVKRKLFSFINIMGLALGVAASLVILKYTDFESSYDNYHTDAASIFRVNREFRRNGVLEGTNCISTYGLGPAMLAEVPEIKAYVRTHPMYGGAVITYQPKTGDAVAFNEKNIQMVDSTFLTVFTYPAAAGELSTALNHPNSIVITKAIAEKYFGKNGDPIGKLLQLNGGWCDGDYLVSAVIDKVPQNSHFLFDILVPLHNVLKNNGQYQRDTGWDWNNFVTYVQLQPRADATVAMKKLIPIAEKNINPRNSDTNSKTTLLLEPIQEIHLSPGIKHEPVPSTSRTTLYFFLTIAVFILSIAWINYINLSTARAMERAREVGIKKAVGAFKSQLIRQFMMESVVINLLGIILAMGLALLLLPALGRIIDKDLSFDFSDYRLWAILAALFALGSVIAGAYPAFVLSSFKITEVLKGKVERGGFGLRKSLVVFQFAASIILIAGTFGVYRQVIFMDKQDKGLTMDQMLVIEGPSVVTREQVRDQLLRLKREIKEIPGVLGMTTSGAIPGGGHNWGTDIRKVGAPSDKARSGSVVWVDPDFIDTYNMTLLAGKNFDPGIRSSMTAALVNEAAITTFGLGTPEEAVKERIIVGGDTVAIVGVLKNYNWNSLKTEHVPFIFKADTVIRKAFSVHLSGSNMPDAIAKIGEKYKETFPGNPYDYFFLDDFFNRQYNSDRQFGNIFGLFAILAIFISCLGLWGLASFTTSQKLKEIGIRKVLGATSGSITTLLSWQFLKLVLISGVIGLPLAWFGLNSWLKGFAFRIGLEWDLFVVPMVILIVIALLTVSLQILRGAAANPARVLRTE